MNKIIQKLLIVSAFLPVAAFSATYVFECRDPNTTPDRQIVLSQTMFPNVGTRQFDHKGMGVKLPEPGTYTNTDGTLTLTVYTDEGSSEATRVKYSIQDEDQRKSFDLLYLYEISFGRMSTSVKVSGNAKVAGEGKNPDEVHENIHCTLMDM